MTHEHPAAAPAPPTDLVMFWNLHEAGIARLRGDDRQWLAQRDLVAAHRPRVLLTTECWGWHLDDGALFADAKAGFGMDGALFTSKTGCHLAVFWQYDIRPVTVERLPQELSPWHSHGDVTLQLPGWTLPLRFMVAHLDPFSPTNRRIESDHLRHHADPEGPAPLILAMDANCVPPGDPEPDWSAVPRHRRADHLDSGTVLADRVPLQRLLGDPAQPLLLDAGAQAGDRSPTFGHHPPGEAPRRIDLFLLSPSLAGQLASYQALDDPRLSAEGDRAAASDHRPVTVRLRRR